MRVLVIGGSGFIGKYVVAELGRGGHELGVFGRSEAPIDGARRIVGDRKRLRDAAGAIRQFAPEVVIDMIASSGALARDLVEVVRDVARRTVVLSSVDVYRSCSVLHGLDDGPLAALPLTEDSPLRTTRLSYPPALIAGLRQLFGWVDDDYDKIAVEDAVREIGATVLRLPIVYGPGDVLRRLQPIVKRIVDGRSQIVLPEPVAAWRGSRGYVEEVARAIALAATSDAAVGKTYNVAEGETLSEVDWGWRIAARMGWRGDIVVLPDDKAPAHLRRPGNLAQHWVVDSTRIRDELGYDEAIDREAAIDRTIAWERTVPAGAFSPHAFDYAAEDDARGSAVSEVRR